MKRTWFISATIAALAVSARAEVGCMDNSYHMKHAADHKTYHYVQCNCTCKHHKMSTDRGICSKCGHYRDPGSFEVVRYNAKKEMKKRG